MVRVARCLRPQAMGLGLGLRTATPPQCPRLSLLFSRQKSRQDRHLCPLTEMRSWRRAGLGWGRALSLRRMTRLARRLRLSDRRASVQRRRGSVEAMSLLLTTASPRLVSTVDTLPSLVQSLFALSPMLLSSLLSRLFRIECSQILMNDRCSSRTQPPAYCGPAKVDGNPPPPPLPPPC